MKYKIDSLIENNVEHKEILYVIPSSDDELQNALELLAEYFKKEFRYDRLQYCKSDQTMGACNQASIVKLSGSYPFSSLFLDNANFRYGNYWLFMFLDLSSIAQIHPVKL
jgi:hypothetical protein